MGVTGRRWPSISQGERPGTIFPCGPQGTDPADALIMLGPPASRTVRK